MNKHTGDMASTSIHLQEEMKRELECNEITKEDIAPLFLQALIQGEPEEDNDGVLAYKVHFPEELKRKMRYWARVSGLL